MHMSVQVCSHVHTRLEEIHSQTQVQPLKYRTLQAQPVQYFQALDTVYNTVQRFFYVEYALRLPDNSAGFSLEMRKSACWCLDRFVILLHIECLL